MTATQPEPAQSAAEAEARVWALLVAKARQAVAEAPELGAKAAQLGASQAWEDVIISEIEILAPPEASTVQPPSVAQAAAADMPLSLEELLADSAVAQAFKSAVQDEVKRLKEADPSLQDIPDEQLAAFLESGAEADYQHFAEQSPGR
jgi:hypothetical protein